MKSNYILHVIIILVGINLFSCVYPTTIYHQHHLLIDSASNVSVTFLRPKKGFKGVTGKPIDIILDGEKLMSLSKGKYVVLNILPGAYKMDIISSTIEGPQNTEVLTTRSFDINTGDADSVYMLFGIEKFDFWKTLKNRLDEQDINVNVEVPVSKNFTLDFQPYSKEGSQHHDGIGITLNLVNSERAKQIKLEIDEKK